MTTLGAMLEKGAERFGQRDAIVHTDRDVRLTYGDFYDRAKKLAAGFYALGVRPGDNVALWGENCPEWLISQYALACLGAVWVPADPGYGAEDMAYLLEHSEATTLIMADRFREVVEAMKQGAGGPAGVTRLVVWSDTDVPKGATPWSEVMDRGTADDLAAVGRIMKDVSPEDVTSIMYTSGTTGKPKGVMVNHEGLYHKTVAACDRLNLTESDRLAVMFPFFHMAGNTCVALTAFVRGAALVIASDVFDPALVAPALEAEKCTAVFGTPNMFLSLLDQPGFLDRNFAALRTGIIGGAPCPLELMKRVVEEVGVNEISIAYGITETSSWVTMTHAQDPIELRVSTIGTPLTGSQVKIVDPGTDAPEGPGATGEICTRGWLMTGYYRNPQATRRAVDAEGWFHTGDLGAMDEAGYIRITGRIKDVIVKNGGELFPTEIEEVIYGLEGVAEVQVFGVALPGGDQRVAAWIRLKPGADLDQGTVAEFFRKNLAEHQVPDMIKFVDGYPTTRSGKVQKFRLSEMAAAELDG